LLGLVAGVGAWFRAAPTGPPPPVYSEQQVADAKEAVCEAYQKSWRSVQVAGSKKSDDPDAVIPIAAVNGRVAEVAVGNFLINSADANPAAPPELNALMRQLGFSYQHIVLSQLADGTKADVLPLGQEADGVKSKIDQICQ
jgi:hypothetical protein